MKTITLTINGREIRTTENRTLLEVIREHAIDDIPTLCYDPKLPPWGSCYLCVVEVEGLPKLVPSCSSPVAEGMVVHTDNERIRAARKTALELLLSNHYADCLGPCKQNCPAGVDVQGYVALVALGRYKEAIRLIREKNPLPLVCGRVCVRSCEVACRRNYVDEAVGVDYLKRFATDVEIEDPWRPELPPKNGKWIAVVGGGPSGLTAAYYLLLAGYEVRLYEKMPHLGGMLRYGIPEYRLPKERLDREISWITDLGVEVRTNAMLGRDFTIDSLRSEGFDAIYLAVGAHKAKRMDIPEEDRTPGVLGGIDFLRDVEQGNVSSLPGRVIVVGGGNTAIDAARTALRLGAEKVTLVYRRTRNEMPAHPAEIDAAVHEGVEMIFLAAPVKILTEDGTLRGLRCNRMELGEPDKSGRRRPVPILGSEFDIACDFIISAIGQDTDLFGIDPDKIKVNRWNTIEVDKNTMQTSIPFVFAGGDVVTGPSVVIDAVAMGKRAAEAIDEYLTTGKVTPRRREFLSRKDAWGEPPREDFVGFEHIERERMPELPPEERIKSFEEVELGFTEEQALHEATRCLECGCTAYFECDLKKYATDYGCDIVPYLGEVRKYKVDRRHPFITLDPNKCISCGRCVRTCSEILQVSALGFVYRGFKSVVKPAMEKPLLQTNCISCGNCIAACPTGAITERPPFSKPGPWPSERVRSTCSFCSVGCQIDYRVFFDGVFTVANTDERTHNRGYLCRKGRFGYSYMLDSSRLLKPLLKSDGRHVEATWDQALGHAAQRLKDIIARKGPSAVAVFGSPRMTNEELYLLQKFARAGIGTNALGSFSGDLAGIETDALDDMIGMTVSTATMDDLERADVIVVMNSVPAEEHLIAELKIKAAMKRGAMLVTMSSSETDLTKLSDLWLDTRRGSNTVLLNAIAREAIHRGWVDTDFIERETRGFDALRKFLEPYDLERAAEICSVDRRKLETFTDAFRDPDRKVVFVTNMDAYWEKSRYDTHAAANLLLLGGRLGRKGGGILLLRDHANSQGLRDMGVDSRYLPGFVRTGDSTGIERLSALWGTDLLRVFQPLDV
ncbi:MAG: NAD(P)-binding protein, partial [Bacteroidota bacterium]|nr:NAD(P)-binding protein [Bacteroidota bacterium]